MIDIKDEVLDTSLQPDNNPRYTIKDNNGRVINDNVQIDLKTPVVTEGTPLNKATIERILQYEPLTFVNQEDLTSEQPDELFKVKTKLEKQETNQITGYGIISDSKLKISFKMINTTGELKLAKTTSATNPSNTAYVSYDGYTTLDGVERFYLKEDADEFMSISLSYAANLQQIWDFGEEVSGTLNIQYNYGYITGGVECSANGIDWEKLTGSNTKYPFENKRYIRFNLTAINDRVNGSATIYFCYFTNIVSKRIALKNNFTTDKGIPESGNINFITSDDFNTDKVRYNSIDNIPVDIILQPNRYYELNNVGDKIIAKTGVVVSGTIAIPQVLADAANYEIELDAEYKAIYIVGVSKPGLIKNGGGLEIEDGGGSTVGRSVGLKGRKLSFYANVNRGYDIAGRTFDYVAFL